MPEESHFTSRPRVSLAELLELRVGGLGPSELLALLSSSCEYLSKAKNSQIMLFSSEQIFLTRDGNVEIDLVPIGATKKQFMPPELQNGSNGTAQNSSSPEAQLVWCLGRSCLQAVQPDHPDVALVSLLNLMTVGHIQSRPALAKVRQMIRNRMDVDELDKVPEVLANLHREVMGDLDELLADQFDDDIRFSSSRSSQLSIIPGPGAPERIHQEQPQERLLLSSEIADRLRKNDFSSQIASNLFDHDKFAVDIPDELQSQRNLPEHISSPGGRTTPGRDDEEEEEELTPTRGPSRSETFERIELESIGNTEREWHRIKNVTETTTERQQKEQRQQNLESIEVEVHLPSPSSSSDHSDSSHQKPNGGRLFTKAAQAGKVPRAVTMRKESEIEVLPDEKQQKPLERGDERREQSVAALPPVTGYSPGTKRKVHKIEQKSEENEEEREEKKEDQKEEKDEEGQGQQQQQSLTPQFRRQNSLEPSRCSRRTGSGRAKGVSGSRSATLLPTLPEFVTNTTQPLIRLRAQSMKKKKMVTLHRSDPAVVFVRLLNGHSVEVNCRTDALVGSIFHTVAEHLNITEHLFFGLALQQQDENIFLEEGQRLEKWAPAAWKGPGLRRSFGAGGTISRQRHPPDQQYILHLRFRYYPKKREFVKTATTAHQLYLQLRQDMLSGALRFSPRERAFETAALALCAESVAPVDGKEYFRLENYLPAKYYEVDPSETLKVQRRIAELHRRLAASFGHLEAEEQFIARCQMEPLYGAHFYRVHKMKPKRGGQQALQSRPLDTRLVAVMPSGIGICRVERGGTQRQLTSTHDWHMIRTLQFDRKRFLLGTIEDNIAVDHVFYTDHHSKASYLVRFAASQHRFMLKMRQWQGTLNRMHVVQRQKDVGVEQRRQSTNGTFDVGIGAESQAQLLAGTKTHSKQSSYPQMGIGQRYGMAQSHADLSFGHDSIDTPFDVGHSRLGFETDKEYIQYCYGSEAQRIDVVMEKDPAQGLGLTLVDGAVNGVKGVYVKSVSAEGDGKRKGLLIGDCLLSINGISLFNKSRHDAVELVRDCGREVRLEILRFPSISEVLAQENPILSALGKDPSMTNGMGNKEIESSEELAKRRIVEEAKEKDKEEDRRKQSTATTESKASSHSTTPSLAAQRRQRAVSDFGATHLPTLRTDDILAIGGGGKKGEINNRDGGPQRYRRHKTMSGFFADSRSSDSESDTDGESGDEDVKGQSEAKRRGEYKPQLPPVSAMYSFLNDEEDEEGSEEEEERAKRKKEQEQQQQNNRAKQQQQHRSPMVNDQQFGTSSPYSDNFSLKSTPAKSPFASAVERFGRLDTKDSISWNSAKLAGETQRKGNNLDWTTCLSDIDGHSSSASSPTTSPTSARRCRRRFTVQIPPMALMAAGAPFKLQSVPGGKGVLVSAIDAEKLPASANLCIGDRIVAVNGISVANRNPGQIMEMNSDSSKRGGELELVVERAQHGDGGGEEEGEEEEEETHVAILDKTHDAVIGLSLAKRMGFEGVFVRNIAPGSIAAIEGTLRVGDRVCRVQGEPVAVGESPAAVVKRLKELRAGEFSIEVRRRKQSH